MNLIKSKVITVVLLGFFSLFNAFSQDVQIVAGSGDVTQIATLFFDHFSTFDVSKGVTFQVPQRSSRTQGGLDNVDRFLFGRIGRALNESEIQNGLRQILLHREKVVFAAGSNVGVTEISLQQLENIITGKISNWSEVGGINKPIDVIGRQKSEVVYSLLRSTYPFFESATLKTEFERSEQVVNFLRSPAGSGSFTFGTSTNLNVFHVIKVTGMNNGLDLCLVYHSKNSDNPIVKQAAEFAASQKWADIKKKEGLK